MNLLPIDTPERLRLVATWMGREENYQWLDVGETPAGVVGLTNIDRPFRTARIWVVAGEKTFAARGHATDAARRLLTIGFRELGLEAVNTWIVEDNPSVRIAHRLRFKFIGRQRRCHVVEGR